MRRKMKPIGCLLLAFALALIPARQGLAAEYPYTYTVTVYAGAKGTFKNDNVATNRSKGKISDSKVEITGFQCGESVKFVDLEALAECIELNAGDNGKYYAKGFRQAGQDEIYVNVSRSVEKDTEYVVAYGVKASKVTYTVRYLEYGTGKVLLDERTGYGDADETVVVGHASIPGYTPMAVNISRKLDADDGKNIFTFWYNLTGSVTVTDEMIETLYNVIPGTTTVTTNPGSTTVTQGGGGAAVPDQETPLVNVDLDGDGQADAADLVEIGEDETPLSDEELDETLSESGALRNLLPIYISIILLALAGFFGGFIFLKKAKKREEDEED